MNKFVIDSNHSDIKNVTAKMILEGYMPHNIEQIIFRIFVCQNCFKNLKCNNCKCSPYDKVLEPISCNKKSFPNILNKEKWELFKNEHNISIL